MAANYRRRVAHAHQLLQVLFGVLQLARLDLELDDAPGGGRREACGVDLLFAAAVGVLTDQGRS